MPAKLNLINQKFGRLIVIREIPKEERKNKRKVEWECQCECGKIIRVDTSNLRSGNTKSCGCWKKDMPKIKKVIDISGQKFGKLLALEPTGEIGVDKTRIWKCQCDCGNIHYTTLNQLKQKAVQSCGCQRSRAETIIAKILENNNINFKRQYWFKDLRGETKRSPLYFDFAIFNNNNELLCLIEYQGEQHYLNVTRGKWTSPQKHDNQKKEYCKLHNIKLIEISYLDFNNLSFSFLKEKIGYDL